MFNFSSSKKVETLKEEDIVTEMCDVCGHSFPTKYITRVKAIGKITKSVYVIRCCPNCNAYAYAETI